MGFLDFITKPRFNATPQDQMSVTPYEQPQAEPVEGLLSAVPERLGMGAPQEMNRPPVMGEKPSLLSGVFDFLKSPQMLAAVGAGLKGMGGDSSGVQQAMEIGQQHRSEASAAAKEMQAKADLARKNAAFKAAYQKGRFDPQAYMNAIGEGGDASEAFSLAKALAPRAGVDGGTAYTQDPLTGETKWGDQREESPGERIRREQAAELEEYRAEQLALAREREARTARQTDARIGLSERREGRVAAGGGRRTGGGGGGPPPPGPGWSVQRVGP